MTGDLLEVNIRETLSFFDEKPPVPRDMRPRSWQSWARTWQPRPSDTAS